MIPLEITPRFHMFTFSRFILTLAPLSLTASLVGCDRKPAEAAPPPIAAPAVPVRVAAAEQMDLPLEIRTIGNVESLAKVSLKPQIAGLVIETPFADGGDVNAGDVLVRIDPRPYEAALSEALARLEVSRARAADAESLLKMMHEALEGRAVAQRDLDKAKSEADATAAAVKADEAAVQTARLNLDYSTIRAPISGRAGMIMVKRGNVVKENESQIVEINQLRPIGVSFALPEQQLSRVRELQSHAALRLTALPPGDSGPPAEGTISFIDNKVDPTTGTIRVRGDFPNQDDRLWPGQFVNVSLRLTIEKDVIVVPAQSVQSGQTGRFVFVIKDGKAQMRPVQVARTVQDLSAISDGLVAGEQVVVQGQLRLLPGAAVEILKPTQQGEGKQ